MTLTTLAQAEASEQLARSVGARASTLGVRIAVVESLTGGMLSSALAAAPGSGEWFCGGIVAYASDVKHALLGVPGSTVVSPDAALAMASSTSRLLDAEFVVGLTGVGGPGWQDNQPPGTVYLSVATPRSVHEQRLALRGGPDQVCRSATRHALAALDSALKAAAAP